MKENIETFSISQVSQMTGVSKNRIRDWHAKGFLPGIQRISVGSRFHRRFSEKDVAMIEAINKFQEQGYTLSAAVERARQVGEGGAL